MSDPSPSPAIARAHALAAVIRGLLERPEDLTAHAALAQALIAIPIEAPMRLVPGPSGLEVDGEATDVPVVAPLLLSAGIDALDLTALVTVETIVSLARLVTSLPDGIDPAEVEERFQQLDTASIRPRFRARAARPTAIQDRIQATDLIELPQAPSPDIAAVLLQIEAITTLDPPDEALEWEAISRLLPIIDLALKYGREDELVDGLASLVVFEQRAQRDPRQVARRGAISQAMRQLTTEPLLQHLVTMRLAAADLPDRAHLLQLILQRFKEDGVRVLLARWCAAPTFPVRESLRQALTGMPRLHDALEDVIRGPDPLMARFAARLLGEIGDARAEELLRRQARHPNERVRRTVIAALTRHSSDLAMATLVTALGDDAMVVRLGAVQALARPNASMAVPRLGQLLEKERDPSVCAAAIAALGKIATPEAIAVLERFAVGRLRTAVSASVTLRIDACRSLLAMRTPASMVALQRIGNEADRRVQVAANQLIAAAPRRATAAIPAVRR